LLLLCCDLPAILPSRAPLCCSTANRSGRGPLSWVVAGDRRPGRPGRRPSCPTTNPWWRLRGGTRCRTRLLRGPTLAGSPILALLPRRLSLRGIENRLLSQRRSGVEKSEGQSPCRQSGHHDALLFARGQGMGKAEPILITRPSSVAATNAEARVVLVRQADQRDGRLCATRTSAPSSRVGDGRAPLRSGSPKRSLRRVRALGQRAALLIRLTYASRPPPRRSRRQVSRGAADAENAAGPGRARLSEFRQLQTRGLSDRRAGPRARPASVRGCDFDRGRGAPMPTANPPADSRAVAVGADASSPLRRFRAAARAPPSLHEGAGEPGPDCRPTRRDAISARLRPRRPAVAGRAPRPSPSSRRTKPLPA
jgi:hypothetical protein